MSSNEVLFGLLLYWGVLAAVGGIVLASCFIYLGGYLGAYLGGSVFFPKKLSKNPPVPPVLPVPPEPDEGGSGFEVFYLLTSVFLSSLLSLTGLVSWAIFFAYCFCISFYFLLLLASSISCFRTIILFLLSASLNPESPLWVSKNCSALHKISYYC